MDWLLDHNPKKNERSMKAVARELKLSLIIGKKQFTVLSQLALNKILLPTNRRFF